MYADRILHNPGDPRRGTVSAFELSNESITLEKLFESMPVAMALIDREGRHVALNQALASFSGMKVSDLLGNKVEELSRESGENIQRDFRCFDAGQDVPDHELQLGERKYLVSVKPVRDRSGYAVGEMVALADITRNKKIEQELQEANRRLEFLATQDPLTGILNARTYYEVCDRIIKLSSRGNKQYSVLFVDLDHFKSINDSYGHEAGDFVLLSAAECIRKTVRASDIIGRVGGEEFSVFLPETDNPGAMKTAETIRSTLENRTVFYRDAEIRVTASIGVASRMTHHLSIADIQRDSDHAMYHAKKEGRNRVSCLAMPCYVEELPDNQPAE